MTYIFIGAPIKVKHSLAIFHNGKSLALAAILFLFCFYLYQQIKPFFSSLAMNKTSDSIPFAQMIPQESEKKEISPTSIDISQISIEQLLPFANNDYNSPIFELNGVKYQITYKDEEISHLQLSPDKKIIGFYVYPSQENSSLNEVDLVLMDMKKRTFKEMNEGDLKVSNWEWKNNNEFIIYINCGTGCHLAHVRSVKDGKLIAEYLDKQDQEY